MRWALPQCTSHPPLGTAKACVWVRAGWNHVYMIINSIKGAHLKLILGSCLISGERLLFERKFRLLLHKGKGYWASVRAAIFFSLFFFRQQSKQIPEWIPKYTQLTLTLSIGLEKVRKPRQKCCFTSPPLGLIGNFWPLSLSLPSFFPLPSLRRSFAETTPTSATSANIVPSSFFHSPLALVDSSCLF